MLSFAIRDVIAVHVPGMRGSAVTLSGAQKRQKSPAPLGGARLKRCNGNLMVFRDGVGEGLPQEP